MLPISSVDGFPGWPACLKFSAPCAVVAGVHTLWKHGNAAIEASVIVRHQLSPASPPPTSAASIRATATLQTVLAAMNGATLGAPEAAFVSAWTPNNGSAPSNCNEASGQTLCEYTYQGHNITAGFGFEFPRHRAFDFISYGWPAPGSPGQWRFLLSLLPPNARPTGCTTIQKTGGLNGPAKACTYRWYAHAILVAEYVHPSDPATQGEVAMDEGYDYIRAAH